MLRVCGLARKPPSRFEAREGFRQGQPANGFLQIRLSKILRESSHSSGRVQGYSPSNAHLVYNHPAGASTATDVRVTEKIVKKFAHDHVLQVDSDEELIGATADFFNLADRRCFPSLKGAPDSA